MNIFYPTGWKGEVTELDPHTVQILLILNEAGKSITYKYAAELIDILNKEREENENQGRI